MAGSWIERQTALAPLAGRQLFFVGGAPRSGTTWVQHLLDAHPEVSCRGEGLFPQLLAAPLDALVGAWGQGVAAKNASVFRDLGGYPAPPDGLADLLLGTAVLAALAGQSAGRDCRAVGEKTPENVFLFPRLAGLFPAARFIGVARDPRDVLASAWRFFGAGADPAGLEGFVTAALDSLDRGARAMLALAAGEAAGGAGTIVTYETLRLTPATEAARLFRFLGVSDTAAVVDACVARTSFAALSGGRAAGQTRDGAFLRAGVAGGWRDTLTPATEARVWDALGWMFPAFGWVR